MTCSGQKRVGPIRLYVSPWIRVGMYAICISPILIMVLALQGQFQLQNGNVPIAGLVCITVSAAFAWLFNRLYFLCSIVVNTNGVSQSFLLPRGCFGRHIFFAWNDIRHVSFSRMSYLFVGENGVTLELSTTLFGDTEATIRAVRELLPERLLSQLESEAANGPRSQ